VEKLIYGEKTFYLQPGSTQGMPQDGQKGIIEPEMKASEHRQIHLQQYNANHGN
jgi:hypothetical protein